MAKSYGAHLQTNHQRESRLEIFPVYEHSIALLRAFPYNHSGKCGHTEGKPYELRWLLEISVGTAKGEVLSLLQKLFDGCALEDILYHSYVLMKMRRGIEQGGLHRSGYDPVILRCDHVINIQSQNFERPSPET